MANPKDSGTFDYWITDRIGFKSVPPRSGNTGDFEKWITDRIGFEFYAKFIGKKDIPRSGWPFMRI